MAAQFEAHGIKTLAQFYTSNLKSRPMAIGRISGQLRALLKAQGFEPGVGASQP